MVKEGWTSIEELGKALKEAGVEGWLEITQYIDDAARWAVEQGLNFNESAGSMIGPGGRVIRN